MRTLLRFAALFVALSAFRVSADQSDCSTQDGRPRVPGVLVLIERASGGGECDENRESQEFLKLIQDLSAADWRIPIGWSPFPTVVLKWRFSKSGEITDLSVVDAGAGEHTVCSENVLRAAVEALGSKFPACLSDAEFRVEFRIPWNYVGPPETPYPDDFRSGNGWSGRPIESFEIKDIRTLDNYAPELDPDQPVD
jgi:hypothetical protein